MADSFPLIDSPRIEGDQAHHVSGSIVLKKEPEWFVSDGLSVGIVDFAIEKDIHQELARLSDSFFEAECINAGGFIAAIPIFGKFLDGDEGAPEVDSRTPDPGQRKERPPHSGQQGFPLGIATEAGDDLSPIALVNTNRKAAGGGVERWDQ